MLEQPVRARRVFVSDLLQLGPNASLKTKQADGTITEISLSDLVIVSGLTATAAELNYNDIATLGTGLASKAVVLDSSGNYTPPTAGHIYERNAVLTPTGSDKTDAAPATQITNIITAADGALAVGLPAAAANTEQTFVNTSPTYALPVFTVIGGDDVIGGRATDEAYIIGPGKTVIFWATSGTQWYAEEDAALPANSFPTHFTIRDDFTDAAIDTTDKWIVFEGSDGDATVAVTVTAPEGKVDMGSGGTGGADDKTVLGLILLAKGSLISLGMTVFECRVSFDQITGTSWGFGLGDVLPNATEVANFKVNSGTVTDDAGVTNGIAIMFSTDATSTTLFQAVSTNGGTVGNTAAEETLTDGPTADTYDILRIEIDASGDARFYINGVLRLSRATAVATTALLIPYIWGDSGDDAAVATDVSIDYIEFSGHRPSSNA